MPRWATVPAVAQAGGVLASPRGGDRLCDIEEGVIIGGTRGAVAPCGIRPGRSATLPTTLFVGRRGTRSLMAKRMRAGRLLP